jgi:predicted metalloprotease
MKIAGQDQSDNVIDERGRGGRGRPLTLGGLIFILLLSYLTGQNPLSLLAAYTSQGPSPTAPTQSSPQDDETKQLLSVVLRSTEKVWGQIFQAEGKTYRDPHLVLFTDYVQSACGMTSSATGPFYCPGDQRLYIDMGFLSQLQHSLGAEGDFAAAYVVAHEVGHHVQTLLGIEQRMLQLQQRSSQPNAEQVKLELQADCFAGVWGFYAQKAGLLEVGDIEEGINAARAVGDDRIQSMNGGTVHPESFTHGSSAERAHWFSVGLKEGNYRECNTF